jgi:hypothetical protein
MKDGFQALLSTAKDFSSGLLCSALSKQDTWVAYFAVFVPPMTYILPVSHHSKKQLRKLKSPATRATLMKLGFNRNTAHRVVFGPSRYGGLGFRDLCVKQGINQFELLIRHLRAGSPPRPPPPYRHQIVATCRWRLLPLARHNEHTHSSPGHPLAYSLKAVPIRNGSLPTHQRTAREAAPTTS